MTRIIFIGLLTAFLLLIHGLVTINANDPSDLPAEKHEEAQLSSNSEVGGEQPIETAQGQEGGGQQQKQTEQQQKAEEGSSAEVSLRPKRQRKPMVKESFYQYPDEEEEEKKKRKIQPISSSSSEEPENLSDEDWKGSEETEEQAESDELSSLAKSSPSYGPGFSEDEADEAINSKKKGVSKALQPKGKQKAIELSSASSFDSDGTDEMIEKILNSSGVKSSNKSGQKQQGPKTILPKSGSINQQNKAKTSMIKERSTSKKNLIKKAMRNLPIKKEVSDEGSSFFSSFGQDLDGSSKPTKENIQKWLKELNVDDLMKNKKRGNGKGKEEMTTDEEEDESTIGSEDEDDDDDDLGIDDLDIDDYAGPVSRSSSAEKEKPTQTKRGKQPIVPKGKGTAARAQKKKVATAKGGGGKSNKGKKVVDDDEMSDDNFEVNAKPQMKTTSKNKGGTTSKVAKGKGKSVVAKQQQPSAESKAAAKYSSINKFIKETPTPTKSRTKRMKTPVKKKESSPENNSSPKS